MSDPTRVEVELAALRAEVAQMRADVAAMRLQITELAAAAHRASLFGPATIGPGLVPPIEPPLFQRPMPPMRERGSVTVKGEDGFRAFFGPAAPPHQYAPNLVHEDGTVEVVPVG